MFRSDIMEEGGRRRSERKKECQPPTQTSLLVSQPETMPAFKRPRKTASQIAKAYRERLKRDPVQYHQYLEKNKKKCKLYRDNADEKSKKRMGQQATIRSAKKRKRDKEKALPPKRKTRKEAEQQRAIWAEQKRKQRAAMNGKQVRRNNEKRRNKRVADTLAKQRQAHAMLQATVMTQTASSTRTPEAIRLSLCRVRTCMPKGMDSYGDRIEHPKVTPRKKTALEEHSVLPSAEQKEQVNVYRLPYRICQTN